MMENTPFGERRGNEWPTEQGERMSTADDQPVSPWKPRGASDPIQDHVGSTAVGDSGGRKSSTLVKLGVTAAVVGAGVWIVAAIADDDDEEPTHAAVCVDQDTQTRVDDDQCSTSGSGGHSHVGWFFFAYGYSAPRVGAPVTGGGSYTPPASGTYVKGGVPREGGAVNASSVKGGTKTTARGGFGSSSKGSGG